MSSQDHTYLCKALFACLNQAVAQIQSAETSAVRLLAKPNAQHKVIIPVFYTSGQNIRILQWCYDILSISALLLLLRLGGKRHRGTITLAIVHCVYCNVMV